MNNAATSEAIDFKVLEGLRGIAAFLVVLNHARGHLFIGGTIYLQSRPETSWTDRFLIGIFQVTSLGPQAVIVFFVLSGFSIAYALERSDSTLAFYGRRALRLYPPYVGGLLLAWLAYRLFTVFPVAGVSNLVSVFHDLATTASNLLYVRTGSFIAQYWSLTHEVIFYGIAPLVAIRKFRLSFTVVAAAGYIAGWIFLVPAGQRSILGAFLLDYAIYFVVGVLAFHSRELMAHLLSMERRWFYAWSVAAVIGMIILGRFSERASYIIAAAFSLLAVVNFLRHGIHNLVLAALGAMSYTLYVTHFAAVFVWAFLASKIGLINAIPASHPFFWMTAIPFCLLVSWLFYLVFERPALQILRSSRRRGGASLAEMSPKLQG